MPLASMKNDSRKSRANVRREVLDGQYCGVCYVAKFRFSYFPGDSGTSCSETDPPTTTLTNCGPCPADCEP
jgi:hypothetical protein